MTDDDGDRAEDDGGYDPDEQREDGSGHGDEMAHRAERSVRVCASPCTLGDVETKDRLRARARSLPPITRWESEGAVANLVGWLTAHVGEGAAVLTYLAMPSEVDPAPAVEARPDLRWLVTRTPPRGGLSIHPYEAPRERHPLGYEQPVAASPQVDPADVDVVVCPGLVFDLYGGRLGRGAGYYDGLLARLRPGAVKVGLTVERRLVPRVPMDPHDVPMNWVVTERRVVEVSPSDETDPGRDGDGSGRGGDDGEWGG